MMIQTDLNAKSQFFEKESQLSEMIHSFLYVTVREELV